MMNLTQEKVAPIGNRGFENLSEIKKIDYISSIKDHSNQLQTYSLNTIYHKKKSKDHVLEGINL